MSSRRIFLILVRLLAFVAVAEVLAIWSFWRSPWTPIERHYLSAYFASSLPLVGPSTVEVQWIWKIGRRQKRQLATEDDVVDSTDGTGMALSQSALDAGWKTLTEGYAVAAPRARSLGGTLPLRSVCQSHGSGSATVSVRPATASAACAEARTDASASVATTTCADFL